MVKGICLTCLIGNAVINFVLQDAEEMLAAYLSPHALPALRKVSQLKQSRQLVDLVAVCLHGIKYCYLGLLTADVISSHSKDAWLPSTFQPVC